MRWSIVAEGTSSGPCLRTTAAGSVVLNAVPPHTTVAGVPAAVVRRHGPDDVPSATMDQRID